MNIDGIEHITLKDVKEMKRILGLPFDLPTVDYKLQMDKYLKDLNLTPSQGKKLKSFVAKLR